MLFSIKFICLSKQDYFCWSRLLPLNVISGILIQHIIDCKSFYPLNLNAPYQPYFWLLCVDNKKSWVTSYRLKNSLSLKIGIQTNTNQFYKENAKEKHVASNLSIYSIFNSFFLKHDNKITKLFSLIRMRNTYTLHFAAILTKLKKHKLNPYVKFLHDLIIENKSSISDQKYFNRIYSVLRIDDEVL